MGRADTISFRLAPGQGGLRRGSLSARLIECSAADCIQSYVPAASLRIAADDIDKVNRTRYRGGRPQGRLSYFQPPASAWPLCSQEAPLRSIQAPANMGYRCYSNLRKAPSCSRLPALVPSLRNIRSITSTLAASVALAKRKLSDRKSTRLN